MKCVNCDKETSNDKFCTKSCAASYNNKKRSQSSETKAKISKSLSFDVDIDQLKKLVNEGKTTIQIAEYFNVSKTCILNWLKKYELKTAYTIRAESGNCNICNTEYKVSKLGKKYCVKCSYDNVKITRKQIKQQLVDYKGGSCERCNYNKCLEALEFHHINPDEKDFTISKGIKNIESLKVEVDKCILLCANCHREEHVKLRNLKQ